MAAFIRDETAIDGVKKQGDKKLKLVNSITRQIKKHIKKEPHFQHAVLFYLIYDGTPT